MEKRISTLFLGRRTHACVRFVRKVSQQMLPKIDSLKIAFISNIRLYDGTSEVGRGWC